MYLLARNFFSLGTVFALTLLTASLSACGTHNPYGDPDSQRERSKDAQGEMRRDTSRY